MDRVKIDKRAADYAAHKTTFRKKVLKEVDNDDYDRRESDCREDFKARVEWAIKHLDNKKEKAKRLLVSMLSTVADATTDMDTNDTDCGTLHYPELRYMPTFEFEDDDILLIKELGEEANEDFSVLTEGSK